MVTESINDITNQISEIACTTGDIRLMEVCGTHTMSIFRNGLKSLLPSSIKLISGPGCPVCVTSQNYIDAALDLASKPDVTICTYGDMIKVPGRETSLEQLRAEGADIAVVYSSHDAVRLARENPEKKVVFLAVGFETTAPATAISVIEAGKMNLKNFFILSGHKLVIPALEALLTGEDIPIDGFICPGHVSVIIGEQAYRPIAGKYSKPCAITGFEPYQILKGILDLLQQISRQESRVSNVYGVAVRKEGNPVARKLMSDVMIVADTTWRAIGVIPNSGLELNDSYRSFDAIEHFEIEIGEDYEPPGCKCGEMIQGKMDPVECPLFGNNCTPVSPVGPCMVSSEGTCAAWHKYGGISLSN